MLLIIYIIYIYIHTCIHTCIYRNVDDYLYVMEIWMVFIFFFITFCIFSIFCNEDELLYNFKKSY